MGGDTPYVDYAIIALVVIIFGVLIGFSFKTWRVLHALLVIAVFFAIGFFIVMAAGMLKMQSTWKYYHEQYVARLDEQNAALQKVVEGDPADEASIAGSVVSLQKELELEMIGRGLVWRSMVPTAVSEDDGHIHVTIDATYWGDNACVRPGAPVEAPAEEAPPEEAPAEEPPAEGEEGAEEAPAEEPEDDAEAPSNIRRHGLQPGMLVFVYREQAGSTLGNPDLTALCRLPVNYLGQFRVEQADADSARIDLVSLLPAEDMLPAVREQILRPAQGDTWGLYQSLPADRHDTFAGMTEAQLRQILPAASVEQYLRDFTPAQEGDPAENVWSRIRFTKPHTLVVDTPAIEVDPAAAPADPAAAQPPAEEADGPRKQFSYFTPEGLAIFPGLRHGGDGTIEFEPGAEIIVPTASAEALVAEGVAEEVESVYVRPLRQYQILFARARINRHRQQDRLATVQIDIARQAEANTQTEAQIAAQETEVANLQSDVEGFQAEVAAVTVVRDQLAVDYQNFREQYRQLYLTVKARAEDLARIHAEILRRLEEGEQPAPAAEEATDLASAEAAR